MRKRTNYRLLKIVLVCSAVVVCFVIQHARPVTAAQQEGETARPAAAPNLDGGTSTQPKSPKD